jgi:hypothetical protein
MPLLDTPADLVWVLLREAYGQAESAMDAPSFRDTKTLQQAVGLKWACGCIAGTGGRWPD